MASLGDLVRHEAVLRMILDYGSGQLKVAAQHVRAGQRIVQTEIDQIPLQEGWYTLEQILVFDGEDIICGTNDVESWAAQHPNEHHKIIQDLKLCLCEGYKNIMAAKRVWEAVGENVGNMTVIQNMLGKHFRWIRGRIVDYYRSEHTSGIHPDDGEDIDWDKIKKELIITVPCNWDDEAHGIVRNAADDAGFSEGDTLDIIFEPVAAAAADMERMRRQGDIKYSDQMCFADIGKGTFDIATPMMLAPLPGESRPRFPIIGTPLGDDAGAHKTHEHAWELMQTHATVQLWGSVSRICQLLGNMSESEFARRFSDEFELRKKSFPGRANYPITVSAKAGWQNVPGGQPNILIDLSHADMTRIFKLWTDRMEKVLVEYLERPDQADAAQCRHVMLTGASRRNKFVADSLKAAMTRCGRRLFISPTEYPVTKGGLMHYPEHTAAVLPTGFWYLSQWEDESWREQHTDLVKPTRSRKRKSTQFGSRRKVTAPRVKNYVKGSIDGAMKAHDRVVTIMSSVKGQAPEGRLIPQLYHIDADFKSQIVINIYHALEQQREHGPLRDSIGDVRECFTKWPLLFADLPDWDELVQLGFQEESVGEDAAYYAITGVIETHASEDRLMLTLSLLCPDEELKYKKDEADNTTNDLDPGAQYRTFFVQTKNLWRSDWQHSVLDGNGQHLLRADLALMPTALQTTEEANVRLSQEQQTLGGMGVSPRERTAVDGDGVETHGPSAKRSCSTRSHSHLHDGHAAYNASTPPITPGSPSTTSSDLFLRNSSTPGRARSTATPLTKRDDYDEKMSLNAEQYTERSRQVSEAPAEVWELLQRFGTPAISLLPRGGESVGGD
ncbi:hypothetical protein LTR22_013168 [Elasticomyces elasticus]|nr:hypothetical protein LTR22_013168 [Elasticomyces elasticus]KAK4928756.1 hypothetical protein LTR49_004565 [Elasticomyces elasticus]